MKPKGIAGIKENQRVHGRPNGKWGGALVVIVLLFAPIVLSGAAEEDCRKWMWFVYHLCDQPGWWCPLELERTTEEALKADAREQGKKLTVLSSHRTEAEARKAICKLMKNAWFPSGPTSVVHSPLADMGGQIYAVPHLVYLDEAERQYKCSQKCLPDSDQDGAPDPPPAQPGSLPWGSDLWAGHAVDYDKCPDTPPGAPVDRYGCPCQGGAAWAETGPREQSVEEPTAGSIAVRIEMEDEDGQLTPADQAWLRVTIRNASRAQSFKSLWVEVALEGEIREAGAIRFLNENAEDRFTKLSSLALRPGESWDFSVQVRVVGETNRWIFEKLIRAGTGGGQDEGKPLPEKSFPFDKIIRVKVSGSVEQGAEIQDRDTELFDDLVPVENGEGVQRLIYPDLTQLAGQPPGGAEEQDYYRRGDLHWTFPGNELVRAVAIRAARYGKDSAATLPEHGAFDNEKQLVSKGDLDPEGPLFPEDDAERVVQNVVRFVHQALMPKGCPKPALDACGLAQRIWNGWLGPGKESEKTFFICQEHSILLGSLLRALGIPVREANILTQPFLGRIITRPCQDAASEVFYGKQWHFFGLYSRDDYFTDHQAHYPRYLQAYETWVGARRWSGKETRFHMTSWDMYKSDVWRYSGYGDDDEFVAASEPPAFSWVAPYLMYELFSPVAAMVILPDGKQVGMSGPAPPNLTKSFLLTAGGKASGIANEIRGAYYYLEGLTLYADASDPSSASVMQQTILIPAKDAAEGKGPRIVLTGTGEGPFEVRLTHWNGAGRTQSLGSLRGKVKLGERVEFSGSGLPSLPIKGSVGAKEEDKMALLPPEPWKVEVEIDWITDTLVARAMGPEGSDSSQIALAQRARQAAVPTMVAFLQTIEIKDGVTFGKVMMDEPGLEDKIKGILLLAQARSVERKGDGEVRVGLALPMRALRSALPRGQFP